MAVVTQLDAAGDAEMAAMSGFLGSRCQATVAVGLVREAIPAYLLLSATNDQPTGPFPSHHLW
jgi:hypothetical protein